MQIHYFHLYYSVTGSERQRLVDEISAFIGARPAEKEGFPVTEVDYFLIDPYGRVSFDDRADSEEIEGLIEHLVQHGFLPQHPSTVGKGVISIPSEKNLFVEELNRLFGDGTVIDCPVVVGHTCYGQLGRDLRVRAEFASTSVQQEYDAFRLTILNRTEGKVDQLLLPFRTVWGRKPVNNPNFPKGVIPHIWMDGSKAEWYAYRPTKADMDILRSSCKAYLDVFREPLMDAPQRSGGKGKPKRNTPCR